MKIRIILLGVLALMTFSIFSQATYQWENPLPQGGDVYGEFFINGQKGWMVGASGMILKTSNGGSDWEIQNSGTLTSLRDAFFINENKGWVVGNQHTVLHTNDGGSTWSTQPVPTFLDFYSVSFINADTGWVFGTYMTVLRTFDGGQNWENISTGLSTADWLTEGIFTDINHGWAVGGDLIATHGTIYKSVDGGYTWDTALITSKYLTSISFPSQDTGYVCGYNGLMKKTTDGGQTWIDCPTGFTTSYGHVGFSDGRHGIAVGMQMQNNLIRTSDGGITWSVSTIGPAFSGLQKVFPVNDYISFICGTNGLMMKTIDQGFSWTELCTGSHATIYDICFADPQNGWAAGFGSPSRLTHSSNGGITWEESFNPIFDKLSTIRSIRFGDPLNGLIVGDGGPVLRTVDGGQTWDTVHNPAPGIIRKIGYFNPTHPVAIGYYGEIQLSSDGGQSWNHVPSGCSTWLTDICIIDSTNACVTGYDPPVVLMTHDQGLTWNIINPGLGTYYTGVSFINQHEGWINASGIALHTADGGVTWESLPVPGNDILKGIHFFDGLNGAGFSQFYFYSTEDGGVNWLREDLPSGRIINSIWFRDQHAAWLAGRGGTILLRSDTVELSVAGNLPSLQRISVYPNPASGSVTVVFDQVSELVFPVRFKLTDLPGRVVQSTLIEAKPETKRLNLPPVSEGLYIGTFETKDHQRFFAMIYIKE